MALKATVFKAALAIADLDRDYYGDHALTLARHPSETDERLMVRLLAFAWEARAGLQFSRGLSADDEPDLWRLSPSGEIEQWIEVGLPDERRLRKGCGRAATMVVYAYGDRTAAIWRNQTAAQWQRFDKLKIYHLPGTSLGQLSGLVQRHMHLQCTIQDEVCYLTDGVNVAEVARESWYNPASDNR